MINPLTSLRFVFALMVFFSHLDFLEQSKSTLLPLIYKHFFKEGFIGVSFFFILSGFVLTYNYQNSLRVKGLSVKEFYIARLARIYPLHFITFLLAIPFTYQLFRDDIVNWGKIAVLNLTLTQSFYPEQSVYFAFNGPSWSISDEMFFYLLFPLLICYFFKNSRWIILTALSIITIVILGAFIKENYSHWALYINPIARLVDFIIGISLFKIYEYIKEKDITFKFNFTYLEVASVLILTLFIILSNSISMTARYSYYYWFPMAFLILVFSFQNGKISHLLSNKFMIYLGEISFGFYLFHQLMIRYYLLFSKHKFISVNNDYILIILLLSSTLVLSHFSFVKYEKPINNWIKSNLLPKRKIDKI